MKEFTIELVWTRIQTAITVLGGWLGYFVGGWDDMLIALVVLMALDYITGVMCAIADKKLSSAVGFKGICKKVFILMLVGVANIVDVHVVGSGNALRAAVIRFYLSNEVVSILENAGHIGLPIPEKMKVVLDSCTAGRMKRRRKTMSRIDTPFKAEHFVAWCQSMLGEPYWYGTCAFKCTQSLLNSKSKQYPSHYGSSRTAQYKADIADGKTCADCVGACRGYAWNNGKQKSEVPDKSANGMFDWAKKKGAEWGAIGTIPDVPGIAVRFDGHVGYYVGNGYVIEWRGFNYGCVRTKLSGRKWTHWYRLPWIDYGEGALIKTYVLGERQLRKGITGADVKDMQTRLKEIGYDLGKYGIDGDFGSDTHVAVMKFQTDNGLEATGVYDAVTHEKLTGSPVAKETAEAPVLTGPTVEIVTKNGGTVNVRVGNGTEYEIIREAQTGEVLEYIATAQNGWNAVKVGMQVGWVSGGYSKKTE